MPSSYPALVKKWSGRAPSSTGGKDYHLTLVQTGGGGGPALVLMRWAKKNQFGHGVQVEAFPSGTAAYDFFIKKFHEKSKQYREFLVDKTDDGLDSWTEVRDAIGVMTWSKMGQDNIRFILPDADLRGVKSSSGTPVFEKRDDGSWAAVEERRLVPGFDLEDAAVGKPPEPEVAPEQINKHIPGWGQW